ncbi:MAG TPA: hypothetical protein PLZ73_04165 [bacterium]|nr:hypothetical protein [bacterium]
MAVFFAAACIALFIATVLAVPVRLRTPEPLRLRYCSLQTGVRYGALSSSWADFNWRKVFDWEAGDTEYRPRPVAQLFEVLTPRIHVRLWEWFGPFLWYPFDLLLTVLIGAAIAASVRAWTGNAWAGLIAGAFWMTTVEAIVGFYSPVRPTKSLATLEFLLGVLALLRLRDCSPRTRPGRVAWFGFVVLLGLFTDEYGYLAVGMYLFLLAFYPRLRRSRLPLGALSLILLLLAVTVILYVLPGLGYNQDHPPFALTKTRETVAGLISRNLDYGLKNSLHVLKCFTGWIGAFEPWAKGVLLAGMAVLVWMSARARVWRGLLWPALTTLVMGFFAGCVLLPAGTDILYQFTYYNRPLTALLCVLTGCAAARVLVSAPRRSEVWLAVLLIPALFSVRYSRFEVTQVEENDLAPYGMDNILELSRRLRAGDLRTPVYLAYPRPRDPSRGAWDELRFRGWWTKEESPSWLLCRYLTPMLYLKDFEKGTLLGDPREFQVWASTPEEVYLDRARSYFDLLRDEARDLAPLRAAGASPSGVWPEGVTGRRPGFWGFPEKVVLAPGRRRATVSAAEDGVAVLAAVVRGNGRYRVIRKDQVVVSWRPLVYEHAFELIAEDIGTTAPGEEISFEIESPSPVEVLGPILLSGGPVP